MTADVKGQICTIADCKQLSPSFSQMVISMAEVGRTTSLLRDQRFIPIIVATGEIFDEIVAWGKQRQYGMMDMRLFNDMDEAIAYAKRALAEGVN